MLRYLLALLALVSTSVSAQEPAQEPDVGAQMRALPWVKGPADGIIGDKAKIHMGASGRFLGAEGTSKFLELTGNLPGPNQYTLVSTDGNWFAILSFDSIGYVKDDEKIDADALLKSMKDDEPAQNEELKKHGLSALYVDGWTVPPHYDAVTKRLEWGTKIHDDKGNVVVNYTTRILGRTGLTRATLVSDPALLDADVKSFKTALEGFDYNAGEKYSEFKAGDHVAEIGLGALVAGGAAAAAVKSGLLPKLLANIKLILLALAAALAGAWKAVKRLFGKKE